MSIVWPPELPQAFDAEGLSITTPDNTIRKTMDTGPANTRRRDTSAPYKVTGKITIPMEQFEAFDNFYNITLRSGVYSFNWVHPYTLTSVSMKFTSTPKYDDANGALAITMAMEMRK